MEQPSSKALFTPAKTQRASEAIYNQIYPKIISGELRPGDRLPPERELAEKLGFDPERFVSDIAQYHRSLSETPPVPPAPSPDGPGDGEMDLSFLMGPPPRPMEAGPYYAIKMKLFHENSVGGMVIDENTRVEKSLTLTALWRSEAEGRF